MFLKNILFKVIILFIYLFSNCKFILAENTKDKILYTVTMLNNSKFIITQGDIYNYKKLHGFISRKNYSQEEIIKLIITQKLFLHFLEVAYGNKISEEQINQHIQNLEKANNIQNGYYEKTLKENNVEINEYRELLKFILAKEQYSIQNHNIQGQDSFLQLLFAKENQNLITSIENNFKLNYKILDVPIIEAYKITFDKKYLNNLKSILDKKLNFDTKLTFLNKISNIKIEKFKQEVSKYDHKALLISMPIEEYSKPLNISKNEMVIYYINDKKINLDSKIINILMYNFVSKSMEHRFNIFILDLLSKVIISKVE
ncbi:MAG: hypothetical protein U1E31_01880 [Rickettsiales bacterium]